MTGHDATPGAPDLSPAKPNAGFFRAAAALYRAAPWKLFPGNDDLIGFSAPSLGVESAVLSVIGQEDAAFGVILFYDLAAFEQYVTAALEMRSRHRNDEAFAKLPEHLGLSFDTARDVPPEHRKLVKTRGWELASENAYPSILAANEGGERRPTTTHEQRILSVVAQGLAAFFRDEPAIRRAFRTGEELVSAFDVETAESVVEVVFTVPVDNDDDDEDGDEASSEPVTAEAVSTPETAMEFGAQLIDAFAASPEADPFFEVESLGTLVMLAWDHHAATPLTLTPEQLAELLATHYPRDIAAPPDLAPELVQTLAAFFAFLARAHAVPHAAACVSLLDEEAARTLWGALLDRSLWSRDKEEMMAGVPLLPVPPKPKKALTQAEKNRAKAKRRGG